MLRNANAWAGAPASAAKETAAAAASKVERHGKTEESWVAADSPRQESWRDDVQVH